MNFDELFSDFDRLKVVVVGDVMLDTYWWGHVDRISPEAPVPVVALSKKEYRMGGAANVALNTASLGTDTYLFSVTGRDDDGEILTGLLEKQCINTSQIVKSNNRITTNKIRIVCRSQQMMRLDSEIVNDITKEEENALRENFKSFVETHKPSLVIFEDYNKGVLTETLISDLISICHNNGIVTTVDPKKKKFFSYKGVDIFKPNLKEVYEALNYVTTDVNEPILRTIHDLLHQKLQHKISLITLSEKGIFFEKNAISKIFPTHVRNIADVSGAGDTVIAVASVVYAITQNISLAASMANIAGGLVCEEVGTAAIDKEKFLQECKILLSK